MIQIYTSATDLGLWGGGAGHKGTQDLTEMCKQSEIQKGFCRTRALGVVLYMKDPVMSLENITNNSPLPDIHSTY